MVMRRVRWFTYVQNLMLMHVFFTSMMCVTITSYKICSGQIRNRGPTTQSLVMC
ncbi:hypothetical protein ACSBR1_029860 [Camellia fascicularis]